MNNLKKLLLALLLSALCATPGHAASAVSLQGGSLGAGAELSFSLDGDSSEFVGRLAVNGFDYSHRGAAVADISYAATARLRNAAALLDWHPNGGGFRLTAGALWNGNRVEGDSLTPDSGFYEIGGLRLPAGQIGSLHGRVDFPSVAPYVGLGWDHQLAASVSRGSVGFRFELGAIYQGEGTVHLSPNLPSGSPLDNPIARVILAEALAIEEQRAEREIDKYRVYPILSVGLSYRL